MICILRDLISIGKSYRLFTKYSQILIVIGLKTFRWRNGNQFWQWFWITVKQVQLPYRNTELIPFEIDHPESTHKPFNSTIMSTSSLLANSNPAFLKITNNYKRIGNNQGLDVVEWGKKEEEKNRKKIVTYLSLLNSFLKQFKIDLPICKSKPVKIQNLTERYSVLSKFRFFK